MTQIRKAYADTPRGQIHYRHTTLSNPSSSKPVLIFLHKSASSSISMEVLMKHYTNLGYTTYAPDMPGFGSSSDPDASTESTIEQQGTQWYCKLYMQMFKDVGIWEGKRGVHILGHHSGASLALQLGNLNPGIVKSVCLVGPSIVGAKQKT